MAGVGRGWKDPESILYLLTLTHPHPMSLWDTIINNSAVQFPYFSLQISNLKGRIMT